jgi:hypothetical protein
MKTYAITVTFSSEQEDPMSAVVDFLKKIKSDEIAGPFNLIDATTGQQLLVGGQFNL